MTPTDTLKKEFEERFGKDGPDRDSDSIGHRAGCDDCSGNIAERANHLSFLEQKVEEAYARGRSDAVEYITMNMKYHCVGNTMADGFVIYPQELREVLEAARQSEKDLPDAQ